jgi:ABC-type oligopeptide transport system substrate-binding subunit
MKSRRVIIFVCLAFISSTASCISESVTEKTEFKNNYLQDINYVHDLKSSEQIQSQITSNYDSVVIAEYIESKVVERSRSFS